MLHASLRTLRSAVVALLLFWPASAQAQFLGPLESLFRKIDGVTVALLMGDLTSADNLQMEEFIFGINSLRGVNVEVLINLKDMVADSGIWGLELAFGVDYLTGFEAKDPDVDLRGAIRGLPTLSAYATPPLEWKGFNLYTGFNTGFVQLRNVEVWDEEGNQYDFEGDTFQVGFALGLFHRSGFFLEGSYRNRDFRSVELGLPGGVTVAPRDFPRSANLSALLFSFGFQFGSLTDDE